MSSPLVCVNSGTIQPTARATPHSKINILPQELLDQIFSDLSKHDLQTAVCVSKSISNSVKAAANFNEPHSIKNFIQILIQKLNIEKFPEQRKLLMEIAQKIATQKCSNLLLLKRYILDVKLQLIDVIKTLDEKTANDLKNDVQPPHFLEDIFELAVFERQIDAASLIADEGIRQFVLQGISRALTLAGNIDRALDVATSTSNDIVRWPVLQAISSALILTGNIDRAIEVATSTPSEIMKELALRGISRALTLAGNIDRAMDVATSITNEVIREIALEEISSLQ